MRSEGQITDIPKFASDHGVRCPHAMERLRAGLPATALAASADDRSSMAVVAETVCICGLAVCTYVSGFSGDYSTIFPK